MKRVIGTLLGVALLSATPLGALGAPIEQVDVALMTTRGELPEALKKRMISGVTAAAEHIYVGKDSETVGHQSQSYEAVTKDIVDRILYGYTAKSVQLQPGATSKIHITLEPFGEVIEQVTVDVDYGNISPTAKELIEKDAQGLEKRIHQSLLGASLDSADWARIIAQKMIREDLEDALPEFVPQVDIVKGTHSIVKVYLIPQGPTIRKGTTSIQSERLPRTLFYGLKGDSDAYLTELEGLPVAFVTRHERDILQTVQERLAQSRAVKQFGLRMTPSLEVGRETELLIQVDSSKYIVRGEGYLDMGKREDVVGLRVHTGIHKGRQDLYLQTELYPHDLTWKFWPSYAYDVTKDTTLGYQYELRHGEHRFWLTQHLNDRWHLRAQRDMRAKRNEFALGYKVHSYISMEYVWDNDDNWLRVIGHI